MIYRKRSASPQFVTSLLLGACLAALILLTQTVSHVISVGERFFAAVLPEVLIILANVDRTRGGVPTLAINPLLEEAATLKARDMAVRGYFAHTSPEGITPWYWLQVAGYDFAAAGENLAVNFEHSIDIQNAWMLSPTHRKNILDHNFTEIGLGTAKGVYKGREATFVVQYFGRPIER